MTVGLSIVYGHQSVLWDLHGRYCEHTIKKTICKCRVETKKLHYGFVYEQLEGSNEGFAEYRFRTVQDISIHCHKDETNALPISNVRTGL